MEFIINNWYIIFGVIAAAVFAGYKAYTFFQKPTAQQLTVLKEWLRIAVVRAEIKYGDGTGELKLHEAYDAAISMFPWVAKTLPFETFKEFVDEALEWMRKQIAENVNIQDYIEE